MKKIITLRLFKEQRLEQEFKSIKTLVKDDIYTFKLDNVKTTISADLFTRENLEYKFTLNIKNKTANYLLKEKNMLFDIDVEKVSYKSTNHNIILEYKLSSDEEKFKIEIIVEDDINE